jgi:hypothetical protein
MGLFVSIKTISMNDFSRKIIFLVEIKARGKTIKDQPMGVWCFLVIYYSPYSKWDYLFKVNKEIKTNTYHLQDIFLLKNLLHVWHPYHLKMHYPSWK